MRLARRKCSTSVVEMAGADSGVGVNDRMYEIMASGDAQRVWFPEMLDELERAWPASVSWEELADCCHRMTAKRKKSASREGSSRR